MAVTGVGVLSSCGTGVDDFWAGLNASPPEGERRVHDFDPTSVFDNPKEARRADRVTQLALAAATQALDQAGEIDSDPLRRGVLIATGIGGIGTVEEQITVYVHKGARRVSPFLVPMMMPNAPSATVSMRWGWQGPCQTVSTACAAGTHALVDAAMWVATGRCDVVAAGGSEAAMTPVSLAGFTNMTAMSSRSVSEPFAATRDGFVIAEGAGVLILEAWDVAVARGATILAEVLGGASTADAHHITAPSPGGRGALSCMEIALVDRRTDGRRCRAGQRARHVHAAQRCRGGRGDGQALRRRPGLPSRRSRESPGTRSAPPGPSRRWPSWSRCDAASSRRRR